MHRYIPVITMFFVLSFVSVLISGAPLKVHAIDITGLFIAYLVPGVFANDKALNKQLLIWFVLGLSGLFCWDMLTSLVIVKRELFMGWFIIYPLGLMGLILLQLLAMQISKKLPYNKSLKTDRADRAAL